MATKSIRSVFIYPPTKSFAEKPDAWWSWPGTDFDAEGRQAKFTEELRGMGNRLDLAVRIDDTSIWSDEHVQAVIEELQGGKPDGLLLVQFFNQSTPQADRLIQAAERMGIPVIYYVGLGVRHGWGRHFRPYRRKGVRFIMSVDNFAAIEQSLTMIKEGRTLGMGPWPDAAESAPNA